MSQEKLAQARVEKSPRELGRAAWSSSRKICHAFRLRPRGHVKAAKIGFGSSRKICHACRLRPRGHVKAAKVDLGLGLSRKISTRAGSGRVTASQRLEPSKMMRGRLRPCGRVGAVQIGLDSSRKVASRAGSGSCRSS